MMRKRLLEEAEVVADGGEPKALIRDPALNDCVPLPIIGREHFVSGYSLPTRTSGAGARRVRRRVRTFPS